MGWVKNFILSNIINFLQMLLHRAMALADIPEENSQEMLYLAPTVTEKPEDYDHYFQQFDYFIGKCSNSVKEIALTGPYGSGKSTLLRTYFKNRQNFKTKFVSLGTYLPSTGSKKVEDLEKAIARQLLYQHSGLEELGSRFNFPIYRKREKLSAFVQASVLTLWLALIGYCTFLGKDNYLNLLNDSIFQASWLNEKTWIFCYMLAVPICLLADVYRYLSKNRLSSINPKEGSFDFQPTAQDGTSFSLHLEELLRFFIGTKTDVVVIEDLDRYNIPEVFESLKELNNIVNQSDQIDSPVRFVYAVRDDVFQGSDRTKFFDAIVPLVPVMSPFNSYERFKELFKDPDLVTQLEPVLRKVSVAVPDMRVLRNIVNEFYSYKKILQTQNSEHNYERLLSFIVYKNLYSHDFAKLYTNETSAIDKAVQVKEEIRNQRNKELSEQYEQLLQQDKDASGELLKNEEEYLLVLLGLLTKDLGVNAIISIYGVNTNNMTVEQLSNLLNSKTGRSQQITVNSSGSNHSIHRAPNTFNIPELEAETINKRLDNIRSKSKEAINQRQRELSEVKHLLLETRSITWPLSKAMEIVPNAEWVPQDMPVLNMLLRDGLVDEHYGLYLNHVLEGKLTDKDFSFLRALRDRREFDLMFKSNNYHEILSYLSDNDAYSPAAQNYGLLQYLSSSEEHVVLRNKIIEIQFIKHKSCAERLYKLRQVLPECNQLIWTNVLSDIASSLSNLPRLDGLELLSDLVNYVDTPSPKELSFLQSQFGNEELILEAINRQKNPEKTISTLKKVGIVLGHLDESPHLRQLVRTCIESGIVELNRDTLKSGLSAYLEEHFVLPAPYEVIKQFEYMTNLVDQDFNKKVELANLGYITQCPNTFISEIFNSELDDEIKINSLNKIDFELSELDEVPQKYWIPIIDNRKVLFGWNIIEKLLNTKFDEESLDIKWFLGLLENESTMKELKEDISNCSTDCVSATKSFLEEHISNADVFIYYIRLMDVQYSIPDLEYLPKTKVEILITSKTLEPSIELFNNLMAIEPSNAYLLVQQYPTLIESEGIEIDQEDFSNLLPKLEPKYQNYLLSNWTNFLHDKIPTKYWLSAFTQELLVESPKEGLIKKSSGIQSKRELEQVGVKSVSKLNLTQIESFIRNEDIEIDNKLNFLIGQIPYHGESVITLAESVLDSEWPLGTKVIPYDPTTYVFLLVCIEYDLLSSVRVSNGELRIYQYRTKGE
ncbi:TPA: hypothetical protein NJ685_002194 [Vibrio parahaemolyticus]|nr:hypothetical protein [Vibrio parahaemolyticus]